MACPFPRCKGYAYEDANHIPLAIRWPTGMKKTGRVIEDFVDFTDIAPTMFRIGWYHSSASWNATNHWSKLVTDYYQRQVRTSDHFTRLCLTWQRTHRCWSPARLGLPNSWDLDQGASVSKKTTNQHVGQQATPKPVTPIPMTVRRNH